MEFRRKPRQVVMSVINLVMMVGVSAWYMRDGLAGNSMAQIFLSALFAVWALFIVTNLLRRRSYGSIDQDGVTLSYITRDKFVPFAQMTWAKIEDGKRTGGIAYRPPEGDRDHYAAFSQHTLGHDNVTALKNAIFAARPDLPDSDPTVQKGINA